MGNLISGRGNPGGLTKQAGTIYADVLNGIQYIQRTIPFGNRWTSLDTDSTDDADVLDLTALTQRVSDLEDSLSGRLVIASPTGKTIQDAYNEAKTMMPTLTDPVIVVIMPGTYTEDLTFDTDYINVIAVENPGLLFAKVVISWSTLFSTYISNKFSILVIGDITIDTSLATYKGFRATGTIDILNSYSNYYDTLVANFITTSNNTNISDSFYNVYTFYTFLKEEITFSGNMNYVGGGYDSFFQLATSVMSGNINQIIVGGNNSFYQCTISGTISNVFMPTTMSYGFASGSINGGMISGKINNGIIKLSNGLSASSSGTRGVISGTIKDIEFIGSNIGLRTQLTTTGIIENCTFSATGKFPNTGLNQGLIDGKLKNVIAGRDSFGGNGGTISASAIFENCESTDIDGWADGTIMLGTMIRCRANATTAGKPAVAVGAGAILRYCELFSLDTPIAGSGLITIEHCIFNNGVQEGILNTSLTSQNVEPKANYIDATIKPTTGTTQETLMTYTFPKNRLWNDGDTLRIKAWFKTSANANSKSATVYFGAYKFTRTITDSLYYIYFDIEIIRQSKNSQFARIYNRVRPDSETLAAGQESALRGMLEDLASDIVIRLVGETPTSAGDLTAHILKIEKV